VAAQKQLTIYDAPNILIIQLKRFDLMVLSLSLFLLVSTIIYILFLYLYLWWHLCHWRPVNVVVHAPGPTYLTHGQRGGGKINDPVAFRETLSLKRVTSRNRQVPCASPLHLCLFAYVHVHVHVFITVGTY
jgi:hypothetical protein